MERRRYLELVTLGTATGLAGCSGGGDDTDDGDDTDGGDSTGENGDTADNGAETTAMDDGADTTPTETATAEPTETTTSTSTGTPTRDLGDPAGAISEIVPDGLDIVALNSRAGSEATVEGAWVTDVTVENTGDEQTAVDEYTYRVRLRDDSGTELYSGFARQLFPNDQPTEIASGESTTFIVSAEPPEEGDPDEVASYDVSITCEIGAEGVYCDDGPGP